MQALSPSSADSRYVTSGRPARASARALIPPSSVAATPIARHRAPDADFPDDSAHTIANRVDWVEYGRHAAPAADSGAEWSVMGLRVGRANPARPPAGPALPRRRLDQPVPADRPPLGAAEGAPSGSPVTALCLADVTPLPERAVPTPGDSASWLVWFRRVMGPGSLAVRLR
jgi:hypothetical protein